MKKILPLLACMVPLALAAEPAVKTKPLVPLVAQKPLEAPLLDGIGVAKGTLPTSIWQGSSHTEIQGLLSNVVLQPASPATQSLLRKLLISPAALSGRPEGEWLKNRLQALMLLGQWQSFEELMGYVPAANRQPALAQLQAEQQLLRGEAEKACKSIETEASKLAEPFWQKARAFCLARQKKGAEADLAMQIAREKQAGKEEAAVPYLFESALQRIVGENVKMGAVKGFQLSPLELAVAIEAGLTFETQPERLNVPLPPSYALRLSQYEKLPPHARILMGERAFMAALLSRAEMEKLYGLMTFKPEVESRALKSKQFPPSAVESRALAFKLIEKDRTQLKNLRSRFNPLQVALLWPEKSLDLEWIRSRNPRVSLRSAAAQKAFDLKVDEALWQELAGVPEASNGANAAALELLSEAATSKRVGEVGLRALMLLSQAGNSVTLTAVVQALRDAGLEPEAAGLMAELLAGME